MAKTTVLFDFGSGPSTVVGPSAVYVRAVQSFISGNKVILPGPGPIVLDTAGQGSAQLDAGIIFEFVVKVPDYTEGPLWKYVPESDTPLQYRDLVEVPEPPVNPDDIPAWVQSVLDAAASAKEDADRAAESANLAISVTENLGGARTSIFHGTNPNAARTLGPGYRDWFGQVRPINMVDGDAYNPVDAVPVVPTFAWAHEWLGSAIDLENLDPVTLWADGPGSMDAAAPSGKEPFFVVGAGTQPPHIEFVRTSATVGDTLITASTAAEDISQEFTVVSVFRPTALVTSTANVDRRRIYGGTDASYNAALDQMGNGTQASYRMSNNASTQLHTALALLKWTVAIEHFNSSESWLRIDGAEVPVGVSFSAQKTRGFTFGAGVGGTANFFSGKIERVQVISGLPVDLLAYESYLLAITAGWNES